MNEQLKALVAHVATELHTSPNNIRVTFEVSDAEIWWSFTRVATRSRAFSAGHGSTAEEAAERCIKLNPQV
jgi:hypothetical protein